MDSAAYPNLLFGYDTIAKLRLKGALLQYKKSSGQELLSLAA